MSKSNVVYECQKCGSQFPKWSGQCPECGKWNTLVESIVQVGSRRNGPSYAKASGGNKVYKLPEVESIETGKKRLSVGSSDLGQVLGGTDSENLGLVPGSVVLLAGEPGIGKSTLLSQLTLYFASRHGRVLYVCGEESPEQVKLRLERLSAHKKTKSGSKENILLMSEIDTDSIVATMEKERPILTIIDSIQSLTVGDLSGMAGSVGQVRESGNRILNMAKSNGLSTFLVGHVTKSGAVAGPKVLEHMVDTVLQMEGERSGSLRILRAVKNRFGAVDEVAVYQMLDSGLTEVSNPSSLFLEEVQSGVPGSCVTVIMEGTRPILTEIQALVTDSNSPTPRRVVEGVKLSRVQVMCAVLEKRAGVKLYDKDVFVNVAGGIKVGEPAADLAIALAIASSARDKALPAKTVAFGEIGLLGEVRRVNFVEKRVREAKKLGYLEVLEPSRCRDVGAAMIEVWGKKK